MFSLTVKFSLYAVRVWNCKLSLTINMNVAERISCSRPETPSLPCEPPGEFRFLLSVGITYNSCRLSHNYFNTVCNLCRLITFGKRMTNLRYPFVAAGARMCAFTYTIVSLTHEAFLVQVYAWYVKELDATYLIYNFCHYSFVCPSLSEMSKYMVRSTLCAVWFHCYIEHCAVGSPIWSRLPRVCGLLFGRHHVLLSSDRTIGHPSVSLTIYLRRQGFF